MLHYIQDHHNKMIEICKPVLMGVLSVTFVNIADVELALKILVLLGTFGYTMWKWRLEYKASKKTKNGNK